MNDWDPANHDYDFSLKQNGIWELNIELLPGTYEYKVLESDEWNDNDWPGTNQIITINQQQTVQFLANCGFYTGVRNWDEFVIHTNPKIVGSFFEELGDGENWNPESLSGWMIDESNDQVYSWEALLPEGSWEFKVVLNENFDQDTYGGGANFSIVSDGINSTVFYYDLKQNSTYYEIIESGCTANGDVNSDQTTNILDIVSVVQYVLSNIDYTEDQVCSCDMNLDETINILDIVALVQYVLGN